MKTDKSGAQDLAAKEWNDSFDYRSLRNGVQVGNIKMIHLDGVNERAMDIYATQQLSKYKAIIEKLLPYAEHEIKMSTCIGYSYEKCKSIIEEAKQLIK